MHFNERDENENLRYPTRRIIIKKRWVGEKDSRGSSEKGLKNVQRRYQEKEKEVRDAELEDIKGYITIIE